MSILNVTDINSLTEFPADSILIVHSDHYVGDYRYRVLYTDNRGNLLLDCQNKLLSHWHQTADDRGVIYIKAITSDRGGFFTQMLFKAICNRYISSSKNLKQWREGNYVNSCNVGFEVKTDSGYKLSAFRKRNNRFEDTAYYYRYHRRLKPSTLSKRKEEFYLKEQQFNSFVENELLKEKQLAELWFLENGISSKIAYIINEQ